MKETIERTWSKKDFCMTIGLANRGVKGLLTLKNGLGDYTQERQEWLINHAIEDVIRVIWRLTERKKEYKAFKQEFLEAMETKIKMESES